MASLITAAIYDSEGPELTASEKSFFREVNPFGYILFARHCINPQQIKKLTDELKSLSGNDQLPILVDQEGGRVARLKPPHWSNYPPASRFAELAKRDVEKALHATYLNARLIAHDLHVAGISVDCAPLADIPVEGAHDIIGDRAFGYEPEQVIALARSMANGLMDGGIVPILKHIPGHGRAAADSHEELPVVTASIDVLRATDFVPFKALADLPMAMTAHVLYTAIDTDSMATLSQSVIRLIRNELGFNGLLLSDDISMKAMSGSLSQRANMALAAGCDIVLHCNGSLQEKQSTAQGVSALTGQALQRAQQAMASVKMPEAFDASEARAALSDYLK